MKKIIICILFISSLFLIAYLWQQKLPFHSQIVNQEIDNFENWNDHGVLSSFYKKAYQKLNTLSLEEKIGQIFLTRIKNEEIENMINKYHVGGLIFFQKDFTNLTKEEIISKIKKFQNLASIKMLTATDEEGGTVVRVSRNQNLRSLPFASLQELFKQGGISKILEETKEKNNLLLSLGIYVNLSPVADISVNKQDYIYERTLGKDAKTTATYIKKVTELCLEQNIGCTLKHFPGYGNNQDTHTGSVVDQRSYQEFLKNDFLPFEAGIEAGATSILVSHNIVEAMDPNPASLSCNVHHILKQKLHFTGVIITDDLSMDAITNWENKIPPEVQALKAGNHLLITSDIENSYQRIKEAIEQKEISIDLLNQAVFKTLAWKYQLHIL